MSWSRSWAAKILKRFRLIYRKSSYARSVSVISGHGNPGKLNVRTADLHGVPNAIGAGPICIPNMPLGTVPNGKLNKSD